MVRTISSSAGTPWQVESGNSISVSTSSVEGHRCRRPRCLKPSVTATAPRRAICIVSGRLSLRHRLGRRIVHVSECQLDVNRLRSSVSQQQPDPLELAGFAIEEDQRIGGTRTTRHPTRGCPLPMNVSRMCLTFCSTMVPWPTLLRSVPMKMLLRNFSRWMSPAGVRRLSWRSPGWCSGLVG
jgi:hypothetical protein